MMMHIEINAMRQRTTHILTAQHTVIKNNKSYFNGSACAYLKIIGASTVLYAVDLFMIDFHGNEIKGLF